MCNTLRKGDKEVMKLLYVDKNLDGFSYKQQENKMYSLIGFLNPIASINYISTRKEVKGVSCAILLGWRLEYV